MSDEYLLRSQRSGTPNALMGSLLATEAIMRMLISELVNLVAEEDDKLDLVRMMREKVEFALEHTKTSNHSELTDMDEISDGAQATIASVFHVIEVALESRPSDPSDSGGDA